MRKAVAGALVGLALGAFSTVSAVEMSVGVSGQFSHDFNGGLFGYAYSRDHADKGNVNYSSDVPWTGGGFNLFLDMSYAELGVGMTFGNGSEASVYSDYIGVSFAALNLGLTGKLPIPIADNVTVFPLLGIDYMLVVAATTKFADPDDENIKWDGKKWTEMRPGWNEYGEPISVPVQYENPKAGDLSRLGFKLGFGMDVDLNDKIFLRNVISYNLRLANKYSKDEVAEFRKYVRESDHRSEYNIRATMSHGITVSLGVGMRY